MLFPKRLVYTLQDHWQQWKKMKWEASAWVYSCMQDYTTDCWQQWKRMRWKLVSQLVLWAQSTTKDYIRAEQKLHSISKLFICHHTTGHVFWAYLYSAGTQHGNLHSAGWPILFCGPTQEPCVNHSQHRRNQESFWKNAGEWTGRVEISKEEIPGSKRSMYGYILTYFRL